MPNVAFERQELRDLKPQYEKIRDCIEGEAKVKKCEAKYLPKPNPTDTSQENKLRYSAYLQRAVFYNVTKNTLSGLVGQIFMKAPVVEVPAGLNVVVKNVNGSGITAEQQAKRVANNVVAYARAGLFVDYPRTAGGASRADIESGKIRPTINEYGPFDIINWRTVGIGAEEVLSLVVLHETYDKSDDGFELKKGDQWRVLRLAEDGFYSFEIWRKGGGAVLQTQVSTVEQLTNSGMFVRTDGPHFPTDANGNKFDRIQFFFVGAENNDPEPDQPTMYDLASLNIAHYRNSADYEEACYMLGQPTPWFAGLSESWVKNILNGKIALGSRGAVPLPEGASAGLLQVEPNTMPFEAMEHKEKQMVALGAKLVEQKQVQQTATEAEINNTSEVSTLTSIAKNISEAYQKAFEACAKFTGDGGKVKYELSTDFDLSKMTPQERDQLIKEWQGGAIAFEEMRTGLRKAGVATLPDAKAKELISAELAASVSLQDNAGVV